MVRECEQSVATLETVRPTGQPPYVYMYTCKFEFMYVCVRMYVCMYDMYVCVYAFTICMYMCTVVIGMCQNIHISVFDFDQ